MGTCSRLQRVKKKNSMKICRDYQETDTESEESKRETCCSSSPRRQREQGAKKDFLKQDGKGRRSTGEMKSGMALEKRFILKSALSVTSVSV